MELDDGGGDEEGTVCSLLASCPILSQAEERLFPRIQVMQQCSQMEGKAASLNPGAQGSNLGYSSGEDAMKKYLWLSSPAISFRCKSLIV